MRVPSLALLLFASAAAAQPKPANKSWVATAKDSASLPPMPGPRLRLTDSVNVTSVKGETFNSPGIFLGPQGQIVVSGAGWGQPVRAYAADGRKLWEITGGQDIGFANPVGWHGTKVWMADFGRSQIAIVEHGEYTKSLEVPDFIRPPFSQRRSFPVFEGFDIYTVLEDKSMIGVPRGAREIIGTSGYDEKMAHLVRVSEDGVIQKTLLKYPSFDYARRHTAAAAQGRDGIDRSVHWAHWPQARVSADGNRILLVSMDTMAKKVDVITVTMHDGNGAPAWTRKIEYPAKHYTDAEADSAAKARYSNQMSYAQRQTATKNMSRRVPSAGYVTLGRDGSVWVGMRPMNRLRHIVGFDPAGQPLGTLLVSPQFVPLAADRGMVWGVDNRTQTQIVQRYTIGKL